MRNAFVEELVHAARSRDNLALIVGDLGYSVIEPFADEFPDRFINAGVAEQNMMGMAAGMASEGYHVFVYSIANFPTFRCAEQIRNDVDYHGLSVTVVAVGGGVAYGAMGYSHHAIQDYALMRSMANMLIAAPGDPQEVRACVRYLIANPQPSYLRLRKAGEPCVHPAPPVVVPGEWLPVHRGERPDAVILTTGATLSTALHWKEQARFQGYSVCSLPLWGMRHKAGQSGYVTGLTSIVTLEDHLVDGGFGSWLLESLPHTAGLRDRIQLQALNSDVCGAVGSEATLQAHGFSLSRSVA